MVSASALTLLCQRVPSGVGQIGKNERVQFPHDVALHALRQSRPNRVWRRNCTCEPTAPPATSV